jgi:conserved oligomeric Golgi complex subunit 6
MSANLSPSSSSPGASSSRQVNSSNAKVPSKPTNSVNSGITGKAWSQNHTKNPIAVRLYKVLGTRFDDAATREALQTLSQIYGTQPNGLANGTSSDINGLAGSSTSVPTAKAQAMSEAIHGPGSGGDIASRARKNLRRDMEARLADGSKRFLGALSEIDQVRFAAISCFELRVSWFHSVETRHSSGPRPSHA